MKFDATIQRSGKTATGIHVPDDREQAKTAGTRQRRIANAVSMLKEGRTQL